ncbi:MAG: acyltransferase family protein [Pseudomonadota bacterium]
MKYRADIDGLRAIAVLAVIAFHAGLPGVSGGFIGVDVFFVISGYLITRIILEADRGFRAFAADFYERRIRRLIPPLILVLAFSAVAAWMLLSAEQLTEFGASLIGTSLFGSNWVFMAQSGYFDAPSEQRLLLHTWSLGIEEQFYLVLPALVFLLPRRWVTASLLLLTTASLAYSAYLVDAGRSEAAFFNSFARMWELGIGALLACFVRQPPENERLRAAIAVTGLGAILASLTLIQPDQPFPGLSALPATLGTALIIYANSRTVGAVLSIRPLVWVGLISYGLYLWHWPLLVALRLYAGKPEPVMVAAAIAISFLLAALSYRLLERPVRAKRRLTARRAVYLGFIITTLAMSAVGVAALSGAGRAPGDDGGRFAAYLDQREVERIEFRRYGLLRECWVTPSEPFQDVLDGCVSFAPDRPNVLILGDSHAAQLTPGLLARYPQVSFDLVAVHSCILGNRELAEDRQGCLDLIDWSETELPGLPYDAVIATARQEDETTLELFAQAVNALHQHIPVTVIGPVPHYTPDTQTLFERHINASASRLDRRFDAAVSRSRLRFDAVLAAALDGPSYHSVQNRFCPTGPSSCAHFDENGWPILIDASHMSPTAVRDLIENRLPRLDLSGGRSEGALQAVGVPIGPGPLDRLSAQPAHSGQFTEITTDRVRLFDFADWTRRGEVQIRLDASQAGEQSLSRVKLGARASLLRPIPSMAVTAGDTVTLTARLSSPTPQRVTLLIGRGCGATPAESSRQIVDTGPDPVAIALTHRFEHDHACVLVTLVAPPAGADLFIGPVELLRASDEATPPR